jgi:hypothetical protein
LGTPADIVYTGLSLPLGGLFDINGDWNSPHCAHREGRNADIAILNQVPPSQRRALAMSIYALGFTTPVVGERPQDETANHWHLVR